MDEENLKDYADNTYNDPTNAVSSVGVLSSPQIEYYVKKYGLIKNYDKSCLKAAVYEMRLGALAIRWTDKTALRFHLQETAPNDEQNLFSKLVLSLPGAKLLRPVDVSVTSLVLPPNSLTFASVYEKFNLPRDVLARFNLKSPFVHKGLMLGGGPIIDPGYKAGLVLPLHNFSNIPIVLQYREPLIKVEFTRTQNPDMINLEGQSFSPLMNDRSKIDDEEFFNNTRYVESSVYAAIEKNADLVSTLSTRIKVASIAGIVGMVALITAFYNLIINISNTSNNAIAKLHETREAMATFTERNEKYLQGVDRNLANLVEEIQRLKGSKIDSQDLDAVQKKAEELRLHIGGHK